MKWIVIGLMVVVPSATAKASEIEPAAQETGWVAARVQAVAVVNLPYDGVPIGVVAPGIEIGGGTLWRRGGLFGYFGIGPLLNDSITTIQFEAGLSHLARIPGPMGDTFLGVRWGHLVSMTPYPIPFFTVGMTLAWVSKGPVRWRVALEPEILLPFPNPAIAASVGLEFPRNKKEHP